MPQFSATDLSASGVSFNIHTAAAVISETVFEYPYMYYTPTVQVGVIYIFIRVDVDVNCKIHLVAYLIF